MYYAPAANVAEGEGVLPRRVSLAVLGGGGGTSVEHKGLNQDESMQYNVGM